MFRHHLGALALLAALALPFTATAQAIPAPGAVAPGVSAPVPGAAPHRGHHRGNRYMRIVRELALTDAQKQQIAGILKNARSATPNADPQTRRANARAMRGQIEAVLTDAQRAQLHAKLAQERSRVNPNGAAPQARPQ